MRRFGRTDCCLARTEALVETLLGARARVLPLDVEAARQAVLANKAHGTGNGRGGPLNILDLMVLGCARAAQRPILCTDRDFAAAGVRLHPASRSW